MDVNTARLELVFEPGGPLDGAVRAHDLAVTAAAQRRDRAELAEELDPWQESSTFLAVLDDACEVIGTLRVITPGPLGLRTLAMAGGPPHWIDGVRSARAAGIDPHGCWDVGPVAISPAVGARRMLVTAALYHGLFRALRANRVAGIVLTADVGRRARLAGLGLRPFTLPGAAGGPDPLPMYAEVAQLLRDQRRENLEAYRVIAEGRGLDDVHVPPHSHFLLRPEVTLHSA